MHAWSALTQRAVLRLVGAAPHSHAGLSHMNERTHQPSEALESSGDARVRRDLNEHILGGLDEDLQQARLVEGGVQEGEQELVRDVGAREGRVAVGLAVQPNVVVAVQELVALLRLHRLQRGLLQEHHHAASARALQRAARKAQVRGCGSGHLRHVGGW